VGVGVGEGALAAHGRRDDENWNAPLIRLERAAGMWRMLWRRMVRFWCGYWVSSRTVPRPMARAERFWPKPFTVRGGIFSYCSKMEWSWKTWRLAPES
jgi:hypothetical protein